MAEDPVKIGAAVRTARKQYRLTQVQLAELVGLSDRTVRAIEQGSGSPSLNAVVATLTALGLRLEVRSS
ncbi:helix-turn-helix domain-containing protein [Corynebacterium heidelbergense]|uniref:Transcriptional regulator n=1 Tax=Corynebacterium heidelbergense TaxID=2055947 RepID=A0A364V857_9CORY|nr:transcriptional regulator [Corynebacterium heidelbergense]